MIFDVEVPTSREGIHVPVPFADHKKVMETIQLAESLGYNAVWGTDFITPVNSMDIFENEQPRWYELLMCYAYAAAVTERIKLGTGAILLPYRDVVLLAKQAATLDHLSDGRLLLGVALGGFREEFEAIRPRDKDVHRGKMLDEQVEALQLLLAHGKAEVSYKGKYVEFQGVNLSPKPVQNPLPIYMPGRNADAVERVARWGTGYMIRASTVADRLEAIRPAMESHGRDVSELDICVEAQVSLARNHKDAVELYRDSRLAHSNLKHNSLEKLVADNWIGTPQEVAEKILKIAKLGVYHFIALHLTGDTVEESMEQMRMFAEEVVPQCKKG